MSRCAECGQWITSDRDSSFEGTQSSPEPLVVVARFPGAAEAGYFADELSRAHDVPVSLEMQERVDAHGTWSAEFVLLVPETRVQEVAEALRGIADRREGDDADRAARDMEPRPILPSLWLPLLLVVAVGSLVAWGLKKGERPAQPPALDVQNPKPMGLEQALGDHPWRQSIGRGVRELTADHTRRLVRVREDWDGDGEFDREFDVPLR